jgi:hypothetical protein
MIGLLNQMLKFSREQCVGRRCQSIFIERKGLFLRRRMYIRMSSVCLLPGHIENENL